MHLCGTLGLESSVSPGGESSLGSHVLHEGHAVVRGLSSRACRSPEVTQSLSERNPFVCTHPLISGFSLGLVFSADG